KNPCIRLATEALPLFDLGFDGDVLRSKKLVAGVREDSEAFKAGVRDGQEVLGMSIYWNDVSKPVRLTVRAASGRLRIEYFPTESAAILLRAGLILILVCLGMMFATEAAVAQCASTGTVVVDSVSNTQGKPYGAKEVQTVVPYERDGTKRVVVTKSNLFRDSR